MADRPLAPFHSSRGLVSIVSPLALARGATRVPEVFGAAGLSGFRPELFVGGCGECARAIWGGLPVALGSPEYSSHRILGARGSEGSITGPCDFIAATACANLLIAGGGFRATGI